MIEKNLEKLCMQPGISGNECYTGISKCVYNIVKEMSRETHIDDLGNVVSVIGKGEKKIILDSHLDEVGFIISKVNEEAIWISPVGDVKMEVVDGSDVYIISSGIEGKIGIKKNNLVFNPSSNIDIEKISEGSLLSFKRNFLIEEGKISATALDNRIGCTVLIEVMDRIRKESELLEKMSFIFVFSVLEEKDCSNLDIIANKYSPNFGIIVDAAYAQPVDFDSTGMSIPELGKGFAIQYQGKDFIVEKQVTGIFEKVAASNNINFQKEIPSPTIGRTNFPQLHKSGIRGGIVNIPTAFQHRECGLAKLEDIKSAVDFIEAIIKYFGSNGMEFVSVPK